MNPFVFGAMWAAWCLSTAVLWLPFQPPAGGRSADVIDFAEARRRHRPIRGGRL